MQVNSVSNFGIELSVSPGDEIAIPPGGSGSGVGFGVGVGFGCGVGFGVGCVRARGGRAKT